MAKKIDKPEPINAPKATAAEGTDSTQQHADDLAILHPDGRVQLRGRTVLMREYGYIEGLQLQAGIKPLLEGLYAIFAKADTPPSALAVRNVFADHATTLQWLMAQAITAYPSDPEALPMFTEAIANAAAWVATLNDIEGDALLSVWWGVNAGFFTRRFRERLLAERELARQSAPPDFTPT